MKNDWRIIQIIVIINILGRGYYNIDRFLNYEKYKIFNLSLSHFWYLTPVIFALLVFISSLIYYFLKKDYAKKLLAVSIFTDGLYLIVSALIILLPNLINSWYILILSIFIGLVQIYVGRKLFVENKI